MSAFPWGRLFLMSIGYPIPNGYSEKILTSNIIQSKKVVLM